MAREGQVGGAKEEGKAELKEEGREEVKVEEKVGEEMREEDLVKVRGEVEETVE